MGWVQKVGNNWYKYEYRDGKNTYIGKCNEGGEIYEAAPGFEDEVTIPPPADPDGPEQITEQDFHQMLLDKFRSMKEPSKPEMVDIEHGENHEILIVKEGDEFHLLMRPKEDEDLEVMRRAITESDAMHDLREAEIDNRSFIVVDQIEVGDDPDEGIERLKMSGREYGKDYHVFRMNKYMWGEEDR